MHAQFEQGVCPLLLYSSPRTVIGLVMRNVTGLVIKPNMLTSIILPRATNLFRVDNPAFFNETLFTNTIRAQPQSTRRVA